MKPRSKSGSSGTSEPAFIRPLEGEGDQVQISFRLAATEKKRFDAAQAVLRAHGKDMPLAEVLRAALRDAARYVEQRYSDERGNSQEDGESQALHEAGADASNKFGEHSSTAPVEEWGAEGKNSASSTRPEAPTPQGSRSTQRVERGGGFGSGNEAHEVSEASNG